MRTIAPESLAGDAFAFPNSATIAIGRVAPLSQLIVFAFAAVKSYLKRIRSALIKASNEEFLTPSVHQFLSMYATRALTLDVWNAECEIRSDEILNTGSGLVKIHTPTDQ
jgi:hypothetical protein